MKEKQLENDAFVAYLTTPQAGLSDYLKSGLTVDNTQLLAMDEYKSLPSIQKIFSDQDGVFNNDAFEKMYVQAEQKYLELADQEALYNLLEYSPTSRYAPLGSKKETYTYTPESGNNPTRRSKSIVGLNQEGPEKYTEKELAQMGKIWDSEKGQWKTGTAESQSLWDKITGETLVYAKYTEDGEQLNPITGQMEFHKKGEWMTDENGNYFTRTINTEELGHNEVVNLGDIITREESWLNKINPLDSDEKEKSIPGVIAKTAILSIPWLIPVVNEYYAAISLTSGLVSLGATFAKAGEKALLGQNNSGFGKGATAVENWFRKFSVGTTEEAAESFFSLENLGQMMADTFGQLHVQQAAGKIANIFYRSLPDELQMQKMSGEKIMEIWDKLQKRNKLGSSLSLGYMGLVSAADVYNDALNSGYDERTAGLTALASAGALFGIMNFNETTRGVGNWFLRSATGYDHEITKAPVIKCAKNLYKDAEKALNEALKYKDYTKMNNFFGDMWANAKSWVQDTVLTQGEGIWKNMIVEGVEEVSEEAIQDTVKGIVDTLSALGFTAKEGSFGGWQNVFSKEGASRYLQTAFGGALGGGLFEIQRTKLEPAIRSFFTGKKVEEKINEKDIIDLILQGRSDDLKKEMLHLKSIFNTKRGATGIVDENGEIHDFKANGQKTQADLIVDEVISRIEAIEKTVESVIPRTYFGTLSTADERRFRENLQFNGVDLEPVFFNDLVNQVTDTVDAWEEYSRVRKQNESIKEQNKKDSTNPPKDLTDEKSYKDEFEKQLKRTKSYFDPKQQAYRQVLGKVITSGQIAYGLSGGFGAKRNMTKQNWMKVFFPEIEKTYEELEEGKEGDHKFLITKKYIDRQYEDFYTAWGNALSDPKELAKRMRKLTNLYMNASSMLEPIQQMVDLDHKTERMKIINEYKPSEVYRNYVDQLDLEGLFNPTEIKELEALSDADKERVILERREQLSERLLKEGQEEARNARLVHFSEIAQKNPFAFSARERINFDLAGALEKRGILKFSDQMDDSAKEIFKAYLNQIAQDSGLTVFNRETLEALQRQLNHSFYNSDNLFVKALAQHVENLSSNIDDVDLGKADDDNSTRKALIDLVSPSLNDWSLELLDSDDFYNDKIQAKVAYDKTSTVVAGDTTGLTDPVEVIRKQKESLLEIANDVNHSIEKLDSADLPEGIDMNVYSKLNSLAENILNNWDSMSFDETKKLMLEYYKNKQLLLNNITAEKTIELAKLKSIEDLIGTDTVVDKKLLEQLYISLAGEILPELENAIQKLNEILPDSEKINIQDYSQFLKNIEKIDLQNISIPAVNTIGGIQTVLKYLFPSPLYGVMDSLYNNLVDITTNDVGEGIKQELKSAIEKVKNLEQQKAQQESIVSDLISKNPDVKSYSDLEKDLATSDDPDSIKAQMSVLENNPEVQEYLKEKKTLADINNQYTESSTNLRQIQDKIDQAYDVKEQCLKFVNLLHDELLRYQKILRGKTIIDTKDPVIDMLKQFYRIIHGNSSGETSIDKLSQLERRVRLSDVTGDSLDLTEDEKKGLDDLIETTSFVSYIIDGAVKWGDTSQDTQGQNINEVWRNYELTFGDPSKANKIIVLDPKDGITVQKYLADLNQRARDLKALYGELNKSKSERYEQFRIQEVKSKIKFLKSDVIRKFHVFEDDDDIDLLEGVSDELLNAEETEENKVALEQIVSQNLHNYYNRKNRDSGSSKEDFEKSWSESLVKSLLSATDNDNPNHKLNIVDPLNASAEARLYQMAYSWDTVSYNEQGVSKVSIPELAMWITQLATTSPKYRYGLLDAVYKDTNISPRIDQENALLAIDFAINNSSICNALEEAIVNVKKQINPNYSGEAFKNIYTLFGTGGSGKTLLMQMLSKHYEDRKIYFSAVLQEKVDDLVKASKQFGKERSGKILNEYFSKLEEYNQSFETALIAAVDHLNKNLDSEDKVNKFKADTKLLDKSDSDINITYKEGSLSSDKSTAVFTVKSNDIEFDFEFVLPIKDDAYGAVSKINVSKVPNDITVDSNLKDSILFMDEITQISPFQWAVIQKLAEENNIKIIGAGDPIQKSWETKNTIKSNKSTDKISISMNSLDIFMLGNLYGAWRADNTSIQETVENLYKGLYKNLIELDHGDASYIDDTETAQTGDIPGYTKWSKILEELKANNYKFTYTLSSGIEGFQFLGTYMPNSDENQTQVYNIINNSNTTSKVVIIDDSSNTDDIKQSLPEELKDWTILKLSEVQGKEFDYAVLWKLSGNTNRLQSSRELFTAITRAKKGSVIIQKDPDSSGKRKDDLFDIWQIDSSIIRESSNIKPYKAEGRDNYAERRAAEIQTIASGLQDIQITLSDDETSSNNDDFEEDREEFDDTSDEETSDEETSDGETSDEQQLDSEIASIGMDSPTSSASSTPSNSLRGSTGTDSRGKALNDTWTQALNANGKDGIPVGIGDWYTRLGISATYLFGLGLMETYSYPGETKITKCKNTESKSLGDWQIILKSVKKDKEYVDLFGFIVLLQQESVKGDKENKILESFKASFIKSRNTFTLDELINLFESFKVYVYERSSEFQNIFFKELQYDSNFDYSFRKINDNSEITPSCTTGVVFALQDGTNVYITTGAVNKTNLKKFTDSGDEYIKKLGIDSYQTGILHKKENSVNQEDVKKIIAAIKQTTTDKLGLSAMSKNGGIYQVSNGVNLRFDPTYRGSNERFGNFDYDRIDLQTLESLNYEILNYDDIKQLADDGQIPKSIPDLFYKGNGVYIPTKTSPGEAKKDFERLTNAFRWTKLNSDKAESYLNFYKDRWILIRKKGQTTPTLTRISYVPGEYLLDTKSEKSKDFTGKSKLLSKYKHKQLINAIVYHACMKNGDFTLYDNIKSFNITANDLLDIESIETMRVNGKVIQDIDLFKKDSLDRLAEYKQSIKKAVENSNFFIGKDIDSFEKLLDSYIARLKWNIIWRKFGNDINKKTPNSTVRRANLRDYVNNQLKPYIINITNYKEDVIQNNRSKTGLAPVIEFVNNNISNYFYENAALHIKDMNALEGNKNKIVVEYINEGTRSFINTSEYVPNLQIGETPINDPNQRVIKPGDPHAKDLQRVHEIMTYVLKQIFNGDELNNFYKQGGRDEFIENIINTLVNLYTGGNVNKIDDLDQNGLETVFNKFFGMAASTGGFSDNSIWELMDQLYGLNTVYKKIEDVPSLIKKFFINKSGIYSIDDQISPIYDSDSKNFVLLDLFDEKFDDQNNNKFNRKCKVLFSDLSLEAFSKLNEEEKKIREKFGDRFKTWSGVQDDASLIFIDENLISCNL